MGNRVTHVKEEKMGIVVFPGPIDGKPNGHQVWMQMRIALASRSQVPQITVAFRKKAKASSNHLSLVKGDENPRMLATVKLLELLLGGYGPAHFETVKTMEQMVEMMQFLIRLHLACHNAQPLRSSYSVEHLLA